MATNYNFGQAFWKPSVNYMTLIDSDDRLPKSIYNVRYGEPFENYCIKLTNNEVFSSDEKYYLRVFVKVRTFNQTGQISLRYFTNEPTEDEEGQIIRERILFNIPRQIPIATVNTFSDLSEYQGKSRDLAIAGGEEYYWSNTEQNWIKLSLADPNDSDCPVKEFNLIFEPILNEVTNYNCIVLELDRNEDTVPREGAPKIIMVSKYTLTKIKNLIGSSEIISDVQALKQIGIQAYPGLKFCIDGELIEIGRSGIYEVNNGYEISFIGFIYNSDDQNKPFLLDYQY